MAECRSSFATIRSSLPETAPVPVSAAFNTGTNTWSVTFDKLLVDGQSNLANYFIRIDTMARTVVGFVIISGNVISGAAVPAAPFGGPDVITYSALVADLVGVNSLLVEPFSIMPVVDGPLAISAEYSVSGSTIDVTFDADIAIGAATKQDFFAGVVPFVLTVQSLTVVGGNVLRLGIVVDGPFSGADEVFYTQAGGGVQDLTGNDCPTFSMAIATVA